MHFKIVIADIFFQPQFLIEEMVKTTDKVVLCGVLYTMEIGPFLLFLLLKTYTRGPISIVYNAADHTELLYYCFRCKYRYQKITTFSIRQVCYILWK